MSVARSSQVAESLVKSSKRKEQLCDKMVAKVVAKVENGTGIKVPKSWKTTIHDQVLQLLEMNTVTEKDLNYLVSLIKKELVGKAPPSAISDPGPAREDNRASFNNTQPKPLPQESSQPVLPPDVHQAAVQVRNFPPLQQKRLLLRQQQGPWSDVIRKDAEEHERELNDQRMKREKQKQEQKNFLDMQVRRRQEISQVEQERMQRQIEEEEALRKAWESEEQQSVNRRRQEMLLLHKDLSSQRENALERKKADLERYRREEAQKLHQLQEDIQREEKDKVLKKIKVKGEIQQFLEYNKVQEELKQKEKKKLAEMDVKALQEYEERLEKQEQERANYLNRLNEKQAVKYTLASERYKGWQDQQKKDEDKARKHQEAATNREQQEEEQRKRRLAEEKRRLQGIVEQQIKEKEDKKTQMRLENERLRDEIKNNVQQAEERERQRKLNAREFALKGMREIDQQLVDMHLRRFQPQQLKIGERLDKLSPLKSAGDSVAVH